MTSIIFENTLDQEVQIMLDGRVKAILDNGETITLSVKENQRVGFTSTTNVSPRAKAPMKSVVTKSSDVSSRNKEDRGQPRQMRPAVPVIQMDAKGAEIRTHPSIKAAAASAGIAWFALAKHLTKGNPNDTFKGFRWRRAGLPDTTTKTSTTSKNRRAGKAIMQLTAEGQPLRIWNSQSEAAESLGIHTSSISKACNNAQPIAGGFRWKFATQAA